MTGIERLYKLIADIDVSADPELWYILREGTEGDWGCEEHDGKTLGSTLAAIADQIKREQGGRVSRMRVLSVVTEMERHCLGHEGMEDSPVARWARELREALGGDGRDHAADVSVSAYDLLPQEDREAIAWMRERGGLDAVKRRWECLSYYADPVPRVCMERRLARRQRQIDECHAALRRRLDAIARLASENDALSLECAQMRPRLMPEGFEWPTFESGEPVMLGDSVTEYVAGGEFEVRSIEFRDGVTYLREGFRTEGIVIVRPGERVKRPAPKVLDADGVEIREGDRVWSTQLDEPHEWIVIDPHEDRGDSQTVLVSIGDRTGHARPDNLTHRAPVLAADGKPLLKYETVYEIKTGEPYFVTNVFDGMTEPDFPEHTVECRKYDDVVTHMFEPSQLTHQRLVLDADGVPIKVGDTVWPKYPYEEPDRQVESAEVVYVHRFGRIDIQAKYATGMSFRQQVDAKRLTHTKPEPVDTWERIEDDATLSPEVYCHRNGIDISQKDGTEIFLADTVEPMARDLVRRCRALAERERSES